MTAKTRTISIGAGLEKPNTTPIPNSILDQWLSVLNEPELKVMLYLSRRTYGFHKSSDCVSLNQIERGIVRKDGTRLDCGTGLSRSSIKRALHSLEDRYGLIIKESRFKKNGALEANRYSLRIVPLSPVREKKFDHASAAAPVDPSSDPRFAKGPTLGPAADLSLGPPVGTTKESLTKPSPQNSSPIPTAPQRYQDEPGIAGVNLKAFPRTSNAVRGLYPRTTDSFLRGLVGAVLDKVPHAVDRDIEQSVKLQEGQRGAGLFKTVLPDLVAERFGLRSVPTAASLFHYEPPSDLTTPDMEALKRAERRRQADVLRERDKRLLAGVEGNVSLQQRLDSLSEELNG